MTQFEVVKTWANWDSQKFEVVATNFGSKEGAEKYANELRVAESDGGGFRWYGYFVRPVE